MHSIIYSPAALETFDNITKQVKNRWGDKYLNEFKQRTVKIIETIRQYPFMFQSIETDADVRKAVIHRNCSVFYAVRTDTIDILFFWDNRQDPVL